MGEWLVFVALMAVGQFSPGPDMLLLTRTALAQGRSAGCWTALGIATGLGVHALIAVAGVASLMAQGGWLEKGMKWAAATYLLWLAYQLIRSGLRARKVQVGEAAESCDQGRLHAWKRGLLCNLLNPKVAVFLAGVSAPFLIGHDGFRWPLLLWATIVFEGALLWCLWVCLLQQPRLKRGYLRLAHWFDLAFGIGLLTVAVALLAGG
ncbi:LysE family transporter [Verrucomicrobiaceae bacterium R5-34]|nr:LysE family transporter [Verrucomicrobiaceae bacterium R5-34]